MSSINERVLLWARGKRGQQVGSGECWDLADAALRRAGAESSTTTGPDDDYVWGEPIDIKDARPGDVLQFRDFVIVTRTETNADFGDGTGQESWDEQTQVRGHHTAIVDSTVGTNAMRILEQHVKPLGKKVQLHVITLRDEKRLPSTAMKSMKDRFGKTRHGVRVTTTVTIKVTGMISAYRPRARGN